VSQQNGRRATVTTTATACCHCSGNANQPPAPNIIKIDAALKTKLEGLLIKNSPESTCEQLLTETNQVIGNCDSLVRAAMKHDRELAGVYPDSGPLPPSPTSYQMGLSQAIPIKKLGSKFRRNSFRSRERNLAGTGTPTETSI
jgi:hypothetical protein